MKLQPHPTWVAVVLALGAYVQEVQAHPSGEPTPVQAKAPVQRKAPAPQAVARDGPSIQVTVDYGAQLMLVDRQGRETGYDPATGRMLENISSAVYTEDSISDATDDSDGVAEAEVRLLDIQHASPGDAYLLHVVPTDRNTYQVEFRCQRSGAGSSDIAGKDISIAPGEQHVFSLTADDKCSDRFVAGMFANRSGQNVPLLTYAFPTSANVHLSKKKFLRIVILYDRDISPSSFVATLNGQVVTHLFHPKPRSIEAAVLPVILGQNLLQLNVTSARDGSTRAVDIFTINVD